MIAILIIVILLLLFSAFVIFKTYQSPGMTFSPSTRRWQNKWRTVKKQYA